VAIDSGLSLGMEYNWVIDDVEEDLSTVLRAGECASDNVVAHSDTWFNRTWAYGAGDVTGACSGTAN